MANKLTKKDNFKAIIEVLTEQGREDLVKVMAHEIELIENKANKAKMTKTQIANEGVKKLIVQTLVDNAKAMSITEIINANEELKIATNGSNQKVSALVTQMLVKNGGNIVRTQEGKKAVFSIMADTTEVEDIEDTEIAE